MYNRNIYKFSFSLLPKWPHNYEASILKNKKKILCTLGPKSLNKKVINRLEGLGVDIFRLNLSHTKIDELEYNINLIRSFSSVPICLDTEGAQVRTGSFKEGEVSLENNKTVLISKKMVKGTSDNFNLYPENITDELLEADLISIDFDSVLLQIVGKKDDYLTTKVINGGKIGSNKGVAVNRNIDLPFITRKDKEAILIGNKLGINHFALSFAENGKNVRKFRELIGNQSFLISKIESHEGLINRSDIIKLSDAILIDRGDLSRDVEIENIPHTQEVLINEANKNNTEVFVATNLLESMLKSSTPTRAEVNDVYHTLKSGADGLVLAAETAIGLNPIKAASMIRKMISNFNETTSNDTLNFNKNVKGIKPHGGGDLNIKIASSSEINEIYNLKKIEVDENSLLDAQQIALGTYSPIKGFMDKENVNSVLDNNLLVDGNIWTLPIILQIKDENELTKFINERVVMTSKEGEDIAFLDIDKIEEIDLNDLCKKWFKTNSLNHPGVYQIQSKGKYIVSGNVSLIKRKDTPYQNFDLSPQETRFIFSQKHWDVVVGFHTRNPIHRAHEFIQLSAMDISNADGMYINPVIGPKKKGDFLPEVVLKSYQLMIDSGHYSSENFLLGGFNTYSRFSGPREAVFTAICRKNMGCTHFIIGRDHAGVGDYYAEDDTRKFFDQLGDLVIEPIFFNPVGYDKKTKIFCEEKLSNNITEKISGSVIRQAIEKSENLPNWYMRDEVLEFIQNHKGQIFIE